MSEHMKKPLTNEVIEVTIWDKSKTKFKIPRNMIKKVSSFLEKIQVHDDEDEELVSADEAFKDIHKKYGKPGANLRGFRFRDNLTQAELAKKLNILQSHISQMEYGKRTIGKNMAQKLALIFNTDYHLFL